MNIDNLIADTDEDMNAMTQMLSGIHPAGLDRELDQKFGACYVKIVWTLIKNMKIYFPKRDPLLIHMRGD